MTASNANYPETLRLLRKYQSDSKEPSGQTFTRIAQELEAACNSHADLVTALRRIVSLDEKNVPKYAQGIARAALEFADGSGGIALLDRRPVSEGQRPFDAGVQKLRSGNFRNDA